MENGSIEYLSAGMNVEKTTPYDFFQWLMDEKYYG